MSAGNAFEFSDSAVFEEDTGAGDQVLHRLRDEHFACAGGRGHSGTDRDSQARDLPLVKLALAGVHARTNVEIEIANAVDNCLGTANGPCRAVEGREEAVAGGIALLATEPS